LEEDSEKDDNCRNYEYPRADIGIIKWFRGGKRCICGASV
jgi:hypothetical protein